MIFLSGGAQGARAPRSQTAAGVEAGPGSRPYLVVLGLAVSFSVFTLAGSLILSLLHLPQDFLRWAGLVVLVLLGVGLIVPRFEELLERPFSRIRTRRVGTQHGGFVLGLALGAVYVPCAGPVLAAITVAGATRQIGPETVALTASFAVGAALPLLIFALAGRRVAERVKAFRTHQRGIKMAGGVLMIGLAVALTFNVTDAIQRAIPNYTAALQKGVGSPAPLSAGGVSGMGPLADCAAVAMGPASTTDTGLKDCGPAPAIGGIQQWLNTPGGAPVTPASTKGKVVLVDFWAYSCINCQRAIPHVEAWYKAYESAGLQVVGVHTPEYAFEHVPANIAAGARRLGITYPIAVDNDYTTWDNFTNNSWPAEYLIDAKGTVRHVAIGEGGYAGTEALIRQLLTEADPGVALPRATEVADTTPTSPDQSPEMYLGARNVAYFVGGNGTYPAGDRSFHLPSGQDASTFSLEGAWKVADESIAAGDGAGIRLRYTASHVYLDVGGTGTITVTADGKSTTQQVSGAPNIYQVAESKAPRDGTVTIKLSPGLSAYSFTFG